MWWMVEDHGRLRSCDTRRRECKARGGLKGGGGGEDGGERRDLDETDCGVGLSVFPQDILHGGQKDMNIDVCMALR